MTLSECKKIGCFPDWFLKDLKSSVPDVSFVKGHDKLVWCCSIHGSYSQSVVSHLQGQGCPECGKLKSIKTRHQNYRYKNPFPDWFLKDLEGSPDKSKVLSGELTVRDKVTFICSTHGPYSQTIKDHLDGCSCPECSVLVGSRLRQQNYRYKNPFPDWFIKDLEGSPDKSKVLSGTVKVDDKVTFICPIHGPYSQTIHGHLHGQGCPECGRALLSKGIQSTKRSKNPFPDWFLKDLEGSPDKSKVLSGELTTVGKVTFICPIHGSYKQTVGHHLRGQGCPLCGVVKNSKAIQQSRRSKNPFPDWFLKDLEGSPDKDKVLSGQLGVGDKVTFICSVHGPYLQFIDNHLYNGYGCPTCGAQKVSWVSNLENKLASDLTSLGLLVVQSCRTRVFSPVNGRPMELDIFVPSNNFAVEVNGLYWHSFEQMESSQGYNALGGKQNYHRMKTDLCNTNGITLVHLWEDSLRDHYSVCFNLIKSKLGLLHRQPLMARKLNILVVDSRLAIDFLKSTHIQGFGQGVCFGLYYNDILVSLIQVKRAPTNSVDNGSFILDRYSTHPDYFVIGGFERLLKAAERELRITRWISYADLMLSKGDLYHYNGWTKVGEVPVDYQYVYNGLRYHKFNFRLKRFKNDPNLLYEPGLTESQLAELNHLTRVYDCGKLKFEKRV